jgi:hypothetical protein
MGGIANRQSVQFDGEIMIVGSRDPEHDAARALLARGNGVDR